MPGNLQKELEKSWKYGILSAQKSGNPDRAKEDKFCQLFHIRPIAEKSKVVVCKSKLITLIKLVLITHYTTWVDQSYDAPLRQNKMYKPLYLEICQWYFESQRGKI